MERIYIVTPCSRPGNLGSLMVSIMDEKTGMLPLDVYWIIVYDAEKIPDLVVPITQNVFERAIRGGVSGNLQRNLALEVIESLNEPGWIYMLDDDNTLYPNFISDVRRMIEENPGVKGFLFSQELPDRSVRHVENVRTGYVDQAQFIIHTDLMNGERYAQHYNADGYMIERLYGSHKGEMMIVSNVLSYYNYLKW